MMDVIRCNMCGKELSVRNDILMEDAIIISKKWGYFSKKDGETHRICICEDCYDRLADSFAVEPESHLNIKSLCFPYRRNGLQTEWKQKLEDRIC